MKILALLSRYSVGLALSIAIILQMLLNMSGVLNLSAINQLENFTYDTLLKMLMSNMVDERSFVDEKAYTNKGAGFVNSINLQIWSVNYLRLSL